MTIDHRAQPPSLSVPKDITRRSIFLGALLAPLNSFWVVRLERLMEGPYVSTISLFANAVFVLFLLVGLNRVLLRAAPRLAFSQGEMLTLYTMQAISTGLAGLDGVPTLNQLITEGAWFGEKNGWSKFLGAFPDWLVVRSQDVLHGHFLGHSSFYQPAVLRAWITPIIAWTAFIFTIMFVAHCLNILVRRQWADRERLTFPIVWLPVEMTREGDGRELFGSPGLWIGFSLAAGLGLLNGLSFLYPSLPSVPLGITDLKPYLKTWPWNSIDWFPVTFYPLAIGLGFLLPVDLLFSCWFFFLFWKAQRVAAAALALDAVPDFPFVREQGFGAILGLFGYYCYTGRHGWSEILSRALKGDTAPGYQEALSERAALLGVLGGIVGLLAFTYAMGVQWWVAIVFFAVLIATLLVVTRIRAEMGPPVHDFHFMGPDNLIPRVVGATALRQPDLAFFTFSFVLTRAHRSDTMPVGLEGLQMARLRLLSARRMFTAILVATALGTASALWANEHQAYQYGAAAHFNQGFGFSQQSFTRMASWVSGSLDPHPNPMAIGAMLAGCAATAALFLLRMRFWGFPFHPIGFAISSSWSIHLVWVPLLIAWVLKALTLRYGGLPAYRRFLPFFLGLILGDCVIGSLWALLSLLLQIRTYNFFGA